MTVPNAKEILSLSEDHIAGFIREHATGRTLSQLMKQLNQDLLGGDPVTRKTAQDAIDRLGFPLHD